MTQKFLLRSVGFEPVTSCVRGGQLDQTSTEVYLPVSVITNILSLLFEDHMY